MSVLEGQWIVYAETDDGPVDLGKNLTHTQASDLLDKLQALKRTMHDFYMRPQQGTTAT